ncbi:MAG: hypothetical protein ACYC21_01745 [Eubacteriales bacterium]
MITNIYLAGTEPDVLVSAEVKYKFSSLDDLNGDQSLTRYVFCWTIPEDIPDGFKKMNEYRYVVQTNNPARPLTVFVLSRISDIKMATKSEIGQAANNY